LRVTGVATATGGDKGSYRFYAYPVNRAPEHTPAAIVPNDTVVGESIDQAGDLDEFTFDGVQGQELNVFFQALPGPSALGLRLDVARTGGGPTIATVQSTPADTAWPQRRTGRFVLPSTGSFTIRVSSAFDNVGADRGPYRFFLHPIDRHPEVAPDSVVFGDSVLDEAIDLPEDIDEFRVTVPDSSYTNLVLRLGDSAAGPMQADLLTS